MLRVAVQFERTVRRFQVPVREAVLGSAKESDLVCPFPGVSRQHARILPTPKGLLVIDLHSKNGLVHQGSKRAQVELGVGQSIRVGKALLRLEEIATGDGIDKVTLGSVESDSLLVALTSSCSELEPNEASPRGALRLVAEVGLQPTGCLGEDLRFLDRARTVLGALGLAVLRLGRADEATVVHCRGTVPCARDLSEVVPTLHRHRGKVVSAHGSVGHWLAGGSGQAGQAGLLASFEGRPQAWQRDLFAYLAGGLDLPESPRREDGGNRPPKAELKIPEGVVVGDSPSIRRLLVGIESALRSRLDILLLGETGVGKEVFARILHDSGPTAEQPYVAVNCAAVPADLLESELFGIEEGVATGVRRRVGRFEQAAAGTLMLDEVSELSLVLQAKLLRVLEEREVLPVGALQPRKIAARVIAATNRPLRTLVEQGAFRDDLYYRLRGEELVIPSLRDRREDIPTLVVALARSAAREQQKRIAGITPKALELLCDYPWPGNVRELRRAVQKAVAGCLSGGSLESTSFPEQLATTGSASQVPAPSASRDDPGLRSGVLPGEFVPLSERVEFTSRLAVQEALERAEGNKTRAAQLLGISRQALNAKLRRWREKDARSGAATASPPPRTGSR